MFSLFKRLIVLMRQVIFVKCKQQYVRVYYGVILISLLSSGAHSPLPISSLPSSYPLSSKSLFIVNVRLKPVFSTEATSLRKIIYKGQNSLSN